MPDRAFIDKLEDVLDAMGLKTFDAPMTLDYRFGCFEAEEGFFRCFVREEDVKRVMGYMEIMGDHVFFVALQYPGLEAMKRNIEDLILKSRKTLGRHHAATFILAAEEGVGEDRAELERWFERVRDTRTPGVYLYLNIWDREGLDKAEAALANRPAPPADA